MRVAGCGQDEKDPNHIKVGVIVGAEQQVAEVAQKVAKEKYGLDVELVTFNDYVLPNEALSKGDIDANAFQHKPYLDQQIKDRGYKLVSVGKTFVYPIAGYSKKIKSLDELKDGSQVAVPNDPTNLGRSLLLLQKVGLIKLKDGVGLLPTSLDIVENPKNLKIVELEAPRAAPVRIYTNAEDLVGKPFRDLGEVSGESCQATNQDSPPNIPTARKRMQINASKMKANAVLLHSCEITSGTPGCYRQAVCIGSALNISAK